MAKDIALYFRHDCNARRDERILALRCMHGWKGYGVFWAIIELLSETPNYELPADYTLLSVEVNAPSKLIKSIIEDFGIFTITENEGKARFYSNRLSRDMAVKDKASQTAREKVDKRWSKSKNNEKSNTKTKIGNTENEFSNTEIEISNTEIEISNTENEFSNTEIEISNTTKSKNKSKNKENSSSLRSELSLSSTSDEASELTEEEDVEDAPPIEIDRKPKIGMAWVLPLWAEICPHLKQPRMLTAKRVKNLNARARQEGVKTTEEFQRVLREQFQRVADSDFLSNRIPDKPFENGTLDFVVESEERWVKLSEGYYDNRRHQHTHIPHYATPTNLVATTPSIAAHEAFQQERREQIYTEVLADARRVASENAAC